jgi:GT2 family glycosyltransferase
MRTTIGIPIFRDLKSEAFAAFMREMFLLGKRSEATGDEFHLITPIRCSWVDARNKVVEAALENGSDFVYFIDDDMVLLLDEEQVRRRDWRDAHFSRLLAHNKDVISGLAFVRGEPYTPVIGKLDTGETDEEGKAKSHWLRDYPEGLIECDFIGLSCCLIKTEVFKNPAFVKPWFWFTSNYGQAGCGEDVRFCNKAKLAGYKIWVDTTIKTGHLGLREMIDERRYRIYENSRKANS